MADERLPHLIVAGFFRTEKYTATPRPGPDFALPARDRLPHAAAVGSQLDAAQEANAQARDATAQEGPAPPIRLVVESDPGHLLKIDSLDVPSRGIEVVASQIEGGVHVAVVHVPEGELLYFRKRLEAYETQDSAGGKPKNQKLVESISRIRLATLEHLWTDESEFPAVSEAIWWEVWVRKVGGTNVWEAFRLTAVSAPAGLAVGRDLIEFTDRVVGLVYGTARQLMASAELLDMVGEVRQAKENPADFVSLDPTDQGEWVRDFLPRITPPPDDAPAICLLDGGVLANPLIAPAMAEADRHCYDPAWPKADSPELLLRDCHGTEMAGVALYGPDLARLLAAGTPLALTHRIESARILPPEPRENERRLYGAITLQTVGRVEIAEPHRRRSFCMAVTLDAKDRGKPSSWSGAVDQVCGGFSDDNPRLFFVSAGNADANEYHRYPDSNDTDGVQDPAQAWNAVTVGACTGLVAFDQAEHPGRRPLAPRGDLSACSTTSLTWDKPWPYKPDIVLEGGNHAVIEGTNNALALDDLSMLTTSHATGGRLLVSFRDTSAATAQAARMGAIIQAEYPELWPEAVRALLIHSAEWTPRMREAFGDKKAHHASRLRRYGYGVPDLGRALHSARSSLTLIAQERLQPFAKEGGVAKTKDMGVHPLPWPKEQLSDLGPLRVTLRVTLSYFIEPKPGRREGFAKSRHRYQSHGLRFEVKRPTESERQFRERVNQAARDEEERYAGVGDTSGWELGPQLRTRGSVHSDWWRGTAADLANSGCVAVYPVSGWWRESRGEDCSKAARYALVVTVRADPAAVGVDLFTPAVIDLYTPVAAAVRAAAAARTRVEVETDTGNGDDS